MSARNELKASLTSWWEYMAMRAACQLDLFDMVGEGSHVVEELSARTGTDPGLLKTLLNAMEQAGTLVSSGGFYRLTDKGRLLTASHPETLKQAAILWGGEHLNAWQGLAATIETGKPAFESWSGSKFFDFLARNPEKLLNYHAAMDEYAKVDYASLGGLIDFSRHGTVMDVGGGLGALLAGLEQHPPAPKRVLFDRPEVIAIAADKAKGIETIGGDFMTGLPKVANAITLARVLHDWPDRDALTILENCRTALPEGGSLYVLENMVERIEDSAALLSLNMAVMCESHERSSIQYKSLLAQAGFHYNSEIQLNALQWVLIFQK